MPSRALHICRKVFDNIICNEKECYSTRVILHRKYVALRIKKSKKIKSFSQMGYILAR